MFAKLLKIFATRCNIKTNIRSGILEELHMKDLKSLLSKLNESDYKIIRQLYAILYRYLEKQGRL